MKPNPEYGIGVEESKYSNQWPLTAQVFHERIHCLKAKECMASFVLWHSLSHFGKDICIILSINRIGTRQVGWGTSDFPPRAENFDLQVILVNTGFTITNEANPSPRKYPSLNPYYLL